jgi:hypothetical protein
VGCVQNFESFSIDWCRCKVLSTPHLFSVLFLKCKILLCSPCIFELSDPYLCNLDLIVLR